MNMTMKRFLRLSVISSAIFATLLVSHCSLDEKGNGGVDPDNQADAVQFSVETRIDERFPGVSGSLTYDSSRKVMVFAGGSPLQTWEWSDNAWKRRMPANQPPPDDWQTSCFFPAIGKTVLLSAVKGSSSQPAKVEMWLYDGVDWQRYGGPSVPTIPGGELLFDPGYNRLLYTGTGFPSADSSIVHHEFSVKAFDGEHWTTLYEGTEIDRPLLLRSLGFDEARGRIVMSGRYQTDYNNYADKTWEFDGSQWLATSDRFIYAHLVYDRHQQRLLAVEYSPSTVSNPAVTRVYTYGNGDWTTLSEVSGIAISGVPAWNDDLNAVFTVQASRTMLFNADDIWQDVSDASVPGNSSPAQAAFMPSRGTFLIQRTQVYDNHLETWLWDGHSCQRLSMSDIFRTLKLPSNSLVYDPSRDRLLLFAYGEFHSDPLEIGLWESGQWTHLAVAGPSPVFPDNQFFQACAYPPRESIILLGWLYSASQRYPQLWELKDDGWTLLACENYPPSRFHATMVYNEDRRTIVMFGGEADYCFNDTWEFDGTDWREIETEHSPSFRSNVTLTWDRSLRMIVLVGGQCMGMTYRDIWTFDGDDWRQAEVDDPVTRRFNAASTYDSVRNRLVIWGGQAGDAALGSLIELSSR